LLLVQAVTVAMVYKLYKKCITFMAVQEVEVQVAQWQQHSAAVLAVQDYLARAAVEVEAVLLAVQVVHRAVAAVAAPA
jgi:hypothetical protein